VCYVGLVFKKDETTGTSKNACCAAQMFLDSGTRSVQGRARPWYNDETAFSFELCGGQGAWGAGHQVLHQESGRPAQEMFIHGKVRFEPNEWQDQRCGRYCNEHVGVRIREERNLKLYRKGQNPVLRGLANIGRAQRASLDTRRTPRIQTYPGREVPIRCHRH